MHGCCIYVIKCWGWTKVWTFPPRGQFSPLGAKFTPRVKLHPWGWTKVWTLPLGDKFHPWGPSSPLEANRVVKNGPRYIPKSDIVWQGFDAVRSDPKRFFVCAKVAAGSGTDESNWLSQAKSTGWPDRANFRPLGVIFTPFSIL
jgi:hypothetical protein